MALIHITFEVYSALAKMSSLIGQWLGEQLHQSYKDQDSELKDFNIFCRQSNKEEEKFVKLTIHKSVMAAISPFFAAEFIANDDTEIHVFLPDFNTFEVEIAIQLIYTGETSQDLSPDTCTRLSDLLSLLGATKPLEKFPAKIIGQDISETREDTEMSDMDWIEEFDPKEKEPPKSKQKMQPSQKSELIYYCTIEGCTSHFFTHVALRRHVESLHKAFAFVCQICDRRYRHQSTLKDHLLTHEAERTHLCDICGKAFYTKELCSSHRLLHGERKLTCSECGAKFKQRNVLSQHKVVCHGTRRFVCESCGKDFATKQNRDNHQRIHTGETPYACSVCQVQFKRAHHFQKHLTTHSHVDKVADMKSHNQAIPDHLDPSRILGEEAGAYATMLAKQSSCEICQQPNGAASKFKSHYHFSKHIRSRGHLQKLLQLSQSGQTIISAHLVPPNYVTKPVNDSPSLFIEDSTSNIFILEETNEDDEI
jgi:hypothetical protein